jgi:hypothetical protein
MAAAVQSVRRYASASKNKPNALAEAADAAGCDREDILLKIGGAGLGGRAGWCAGPSNVVGSDGSCRDTGKADAATPHPDAPGSD